jgi:Ca-activated chloride channel homolog
VLDTSGSMETETADGATRLDVVRRAALEGIGHLHDGHEVGLWAFSSDSTGAPGAPPPVRELVPLSPLGEARPRLVEEVEGLVPQGGTPLYHVVRRAHDRLAEGLDPGRINAIVVLTDGENDYPQDNDLDALLEDIDALRREQAGEASVRIFSIAFSDEASFEVMEQVSSHTRAQAYDATDPASVEQVFVDVLSNV